MPRPDVHTVPEEEGFEEAIPAEFEEMAGLEATAGSWLRAVSGSYEWRRLGFGGASNGEAAEEEADPLAGILPPVQCEQLRLDVDGPYPQMQASGTIIRTIKSRVHWIAKLRPIRPNVWQGPIWYKDGDTATFPFIKVVIYVSGWYPTARRATIVFSGGWARPIRRTLKYRSSCFHPVEFEFDCAEGTSTLTKINTHDHPNRPATLVEEDLTIQTAYRRAGFDVRCSGGDSVVPIAGAGPGARWSDMEMHDAMQAYWSRFANKAQWSMWVFFAALHEMGTSLGGIMFDDIGPNHRQGTAIFNDSFISQAPSGDPAPDAWVRRMRFWTACHEMGHAFNLAHSWQKSLAADGRGPWIPLADEPEARSFMNYPYRVSGGQSAFFADFEYRFSDAELLFLRHAPERFVRMGDADWFDDHGFREARVSAEPALELQLRPNRGDASFEFLEPPILELKLKNVSSQPQLVPEKILADSGQMTVIVKKKGKPARQFCPYAERCWQPTQTTLEPGQSLYEPLSAFAGREGWELAEPGDYVVQVALHREGEDIVSNPLRLRIRPPHDRQEDVLAQDVFTDDVGRILTFGGSQFLETGIATLQQAIEDFGDRRLAIHARIALGNVLAREFKRLDFAESRRELAPAHELNAKIRVTRADEDAARKQLHTALVDPEETAAETLGNITYRNYAERYSEWLFDQGERDEAADVEKCVLRVLSDRGVLAGVLEEIEQRRDQYKRHTAEKASRRVQTKK